MRRRFHWITASLAVAGLSLTGLTLSAQMTDRSTSEQPSRISGPGQENIIHEQTNMTAQTGAATTLPLPEGVAPKKTSRGAEEAIRDVFRTATNAAVRGDLNKLSEQLAGPDRSRLHQFSSQDLTSFSGVAGAVRNTWNQRFNVDFLKLGEKNAVYGPESMTVQTGEISDPARLETRWPVDPSSGMVMSGMSTMSPAPESTGGATEGHYLKKGRDVAVVSLPAQGSLPPLFVSMTHEAPDFWKIDIPDSMSQAEIRDNLTAEFNEMQREGQTSKTSDEAYRETTHRILMALYGIGEGRTTGTSSGSARPSPGTPGGGSVTIR